VGLQFVKPDDEFACSNR